jgi:two-component sensor histidine kinase
MGVTDYVNPTKNTYSYKLHNFDSEWIDNGNLNTATYKNVPPGDYVFQARGANAAGVWNYDGVSLNIRVLPPWWRTWWAYSLYLLLALFAIWGGLRIHRIQLLKEQAIRIAEEARDTAFRAQDDLQESHDFQDQLVMANHRHHLSTLSLIRRCLNPSAEMSSANEHLSRCLKAMELLEQSYYFQGGSLMANLHSYTDELTGLLLRTAAVDSSAVTFINTVSPSLIPAEIASPAAIILYELLDNSLQHAFSDGSPANYVQIGLEISSENNGSLQLMRIMVQDDGIGIPGHIDVSGGDSMGFNIIDSLCDHLGGTFSASNSNGCLVEVTIPYYEALGEVC